MKKKARIFAVVAAVIVLAVVAVLIPVFSRESVAIRAGKKAYSLYLSGNETGSLDTKDFLYVQEGSVVVIKGGVPAKTVYATKREALQYLYDDAATVTDESLGYCAVETQTEKLFGCVTGSLFAGKKISILGDSISTFGGVSNNTAYNSTLGEHYVYYNSPEKPEAPALTQQDTWWQQVIDILGMELCVNNSSSGTRIRTNINAAINAGYKERCVQLHNVLGEEPDVIVVFLGTNDFTRDYFYLGSVEALDYDALTAAVDAGDEVPLTVCEAYAIMLYKIKQRYPDAEIYCMTLLPRRATAISGKEDYSQYGQPLDFNESLRTIAAHFGCAVVDLENCGIPNDGPGFDYFIEDRGLHPGKYGMDVISNAVISALLGEEPYTLKAVEELIDVE